MVPGTIVRLKKNTKHAFIAGKDGAVYMEVSGPSNDKADDFSHGKMVRIPKAVYLQDGELDALPPLDAIVSLYQTVTPARTPKPLAEPYSLATIEALWSKWRQHAVNRVDPAKAAASLLNPVTHEKIQQWLIESSHLITGNAEVLYAHCLSILAQRGIAYLGNLPARRVSTKTYGEINRFHNIGSLYFTIDDYLTGEDAGIKGGIFGQLPNQYALSTKQTADVTFVPTTGEALVLVSPGKYRIIRQPNAFDPKDIPAETKAAYRARMRKLGKPQSRLNMIRLVPGVELQIEQGANMAVLAGDNGFAAYQFTNPEGEPEETPAEPTEAPVVAKVEIDSLSPADQQRVNERGGMIGDAPIHVPRPYTSPFMERTRSAREKFKARTVFTVTIPESQMNRIVHKIRTSCRLDEGEEIYTLDPSDKFNIAAIMATRLYKESPQIRGYITRLLTLLESSPHEQHQQDFADINATVKSLHQHGTPLGGGTKSPVLRAARRAGVAGGATSAKGKLAKAQVWAIDQLPTDTNSVAEISALVERAIEHHQLTDITLADEAAIKTALFKAAGMTPKPAGPLQQFTLTLPERTHTVEAHGDFLLVEHETEPGKGTIRTMHNMRTDEKVAAGDLFPPNISMTDTHYVWHYTSGGGKCNLFDLTTGKLVPELSAPTPGLKNVQTAKVNLTLYAYLHGASKELTVVSLADKTERTDLGLDPGVRVGSFDLNDDYLAVVLAETGKLVVKRTENGENVELHGIESADLTSSTLKLMPNNRLLIITRLEDGSNNTAIVLNLETGQPVNNLAGHMLMPDRCRNWDTLGPELAIINKEGFVVIYDTLTGERIHEGELRCSQLTAAPSSSDAPRLFLTKNAYTVLRQPSSGSDIINRGTGQKQVDQPVKVEVAADSQWNISLSGDDNKQAIELTTSLPLDVQKLLDERGTPISGTPPEISFLGSLPGGRLEENTPVLVTGSEITLPFLQGIASVNPESEQARNIQVYNWNPVTKSIALTPASTWLAREIDGEEKIIGQDSYGMVALSPHRINPEAVYSARIIDGRLELIARPDSDHQSRLSKHGEAIIAGFQSVEIGEKDGVRIANYTYRLTDGREISNELRSDRGLTHARGTPYDDELIVLLHHPVFMRDLTRNSIAWMDLLNPEIAYVPEEFREAIRNLQPAITSTTATEPDPTDDAGSGA